MLYFLCSISSRKPLLQTLVANGYMYSTVFHFDYRERTSWLTHIICWSNQICSCSRLICKEEVPKTSLAQSIDESKKTMKMGRGGDLYKYRFSIFFPNLASVICSVRLVLWSRAGCYLITLTPDGCCCCNMIFSCMKYVYSFRTFDRKERSFWHACV